jgi:CoA transferase family III
MPVRYPAAVGSLPPSAPVIGRWADSGLMALTGSPTVPLGPPAPLLPGLERLGRRFRELDPVALMGERAVFSDFRPAGTVSCGGSCHLLPCDDGWLAVSLPRPDDIAALPAWLPGDDVPVTTEPTPELWSSIAQAVAHRRTDTLLPRALLLQLPVGIVDEGSTRPGVLRHRLGDAPSRPDYDGLIVVDLTALWAGPLCGDLLARAGATVIKVESSIRPDGARRGPAPFFDLLNGTKQSVALDFRSRDGLSALHSLLRRADVVLEASRPRALEQLGIRASDLIVAGGPQVWVSITGYGRSGPDGSRVAFGDDAAAAAGLLTRVDGTPRFCADAIADPLTGLAAADACLAALDAGGRWLLDVSMVAVAAEMAGPTLDIPPGISVAPPRARKPLARAPALGADTARVLRETVGSRRSLPGVIP